jgi:hypothetical protein
MQSGGVGWVMPRMLPCSPRNALTSVLHALLAIPEVKLHYQNNEGGTSSSRYFGALIRDMTYGRNARDSCYPALLKFLQEHLPPFGIHDPHKILTHILEDCLTVRPPVFAISELRTTCCNSHQQSNSQILLPPQPYFYVAIPVAPPVFGPAPLTLINDIFQPHHLQLCPPNSAPHAASVHCLFTFINMLPIQIHNLSRTDECIRLDEHCLLGGKEVWLHSVLVVLAPYKTYTRGRNIMGESVWYLCDEREVVQLQQTFFTLPPTTYAFLFFSAKSVCPPYLFTSASEALNGRTFGMHDDNQ